MTEVNPPDWLTDYVRRGLQLVFYPARQKGPTGQEASGWTSRVYNPKDYRPGDNVGVKLGTEVKPGHYLVDVDFDWPSGLVLAKRLLPATGFGFGRSGRITHAFYTVSQPVPSKQFIDISGRVLVELRCRKIDNTIGLQTMVPPSTHPSGEVLELRIGNEITHNDDLPRALLLYAIGCCFLFHLGERGFKHDMRMAFAGFLLQAGLTEEEVVNLGEALAEATGNTVSDVATTIRSTVQRLKQGDKIQGKGSLVQILGKDDGPKILRRIKDWLGGGDFIANDKDQIIANHQENIRRALAKLDAELSYDQFSERNMVRWNDYHGALNDQVRNRLWLEIDSQFHFRPSPDFFDVVLQDTCSQNPYHPVLAYLDSLVWDEKPRLDTWLVDCAGAADSDYVRAVSSLVLIAAVRRVRQPGCKFDELLVLETLTQGMLKSTALRSLCPNPNWFSDDLPLNVDAKQIIERTAGKWIIEAAELSGMHRSQVEHLKSMLSRQVDGPVRLAYARMAVERARQFIGIGTTNSQMYLKDHTGNRRFWPVRLTRFDVQRLISIRDQLWAEAAAREKAGESIRLDPKLYEAAELQQSRRKIEDSWENILGAIFDPDKEHRLTTPEVFERLGIPPANQDPNSIERLNSVMQSLGFRRIAVRDRFKVVRKGWGRDPLQGGLKEEEV